MPRPLFNKIIELEATPIGDIHKPNIVKKELRIVAKSGFEMTEFNNRKTSTNRNCIKTYENYLIKTDIKPNKNY
jgi:hypothetical protein